MLGPFPIWFLTIPNNFRKYFFLKKKCVYLTLIRSPLWSLVKPEKNMLDPILAFWNLPWPWRGSLPCGEPIPPVESLLPLWRAYSPCGEPIHPVESLFPLLKWKNMKNEKVEKWKNWKRPKFQNLPTIYFIRKNLWLRKMNNQKNETSTKNKNLERGKWQNWKTLNSQISYPNIS